MSETPTKFEKRWRALRRWLAFQRDLAASEAGETRLPMETRRIWSARHSANCTALEAMRRLTREIRR
jgi:hypothetical protein